MSENDSKGSIEKPQPKQSPSQILKRYQKYHRRLGHVGAEKLRNLHKVTKLEQRIIIPNEIPPCEVCRISKMKNRMNKTLSPWKADTLALIYVDACGPLPKSLRGNIYFGQIVDSSTRRVWSIPAKSRDELVLKLKAWKVRVEKDAGHSIISIRIDNAAELKSLLTRWADEEGIHHEPTVAHQHNQNGPAERSIQTAEGDARAFLLDAGLPIEFWDEAVEAGTYSRNRSMCGPKRNGIRHTPIGAYTGEPPEVDHIMPFGCKCYTWVSRDSLPKHGRTDKLMQPGRVGVFMGYSDETTKQYKVYAPDLGYTIMSSVVDFDENVLGGTVDLKIRGAYPQGTPNVLPNRNPVGRPKETLTKVDLPPRSQLNNFEIVIPSRKQAEGTPDKQAQPRGPDARHLGTQMPGNQMPGTQMPDSQMPRHSDARMPDSQMPGTQMPGTQMPGTQMPGTQMPKIQMPGTEMPETQMP
jgi:hypothetical protein